MEIIDRLNREVNACLSDPKIATRFADLGSVPMQMTPAELGRFIVAETDKWSR